MSSATAELLPHPASPCDAIRRVAVTVGPEASAGGMLISFRIEGDICRLRLPEAGSALRIDGLWQHTCFEAFLRAAADDGYHEFNFAPSGAWTAYRFTSRRHGQESPAMSAPRIEFRRSADSCNMNAAISLAALPDLARATELHAGLAAVIEDESGGLSWWALAHHAERPDFHDPATFTMRVSPR